VGIVHPCTIYGAMTAGRPILAFAPAQSHIGQLLAEGSIGWRVNHDSPARAVAILQSAVSSPHGILAVMGENAESVAANKYAPTHLIEQLCCTVASA
jgi:colanic acid biosynthesis glycosyl transferase WcaI